MIEPWILCYRSSNGQRAACTSNATSPFYQQCTLWVNEVVEELRSSIATTRQVLQWEKEALQCSQAAGARRGGNDTVAREEEDGVCSSTKIRISDEDRILAAHLAAPVDLCRHGPHWLFLHEDVNATLKELFQWDRTSSSSDCGGSDDDLVVAAAAASSSPNNSKMRGAAENAITSAALIEENLPATSTLPVAIAAVNGRSTTAAASRHGTEFRVHVVDEFIHQNRRLIMAWSRRCRRWCPSLTNPWRELDGDTVLLHKDEEPSSASSCGAAAAVSAQGGPLDTTTGVPLSPTYQPSLGLDSLEAFGVVLPREGRSQRMQWSDFSHGALRNHPHAADGDSSSSCRVWQFVVRGAAERLADNLRITRRRSLCCEAETKCGDGRGGGWWRVMDAESDTVALTAASAAMRSPQKFLSLRTTTTTTTTSHSAADDVWSIGVAGLCLVLHDVLPPRSDEEENTAGSSLLSWLHSKETLSDCRREGKKGVDDHHKEDVNFGNGSDDMRVALAALWALAEDAPMNEVAMRMTPAGTTAPCFAAGHHDVITRRLYWFIERLRRRFLQEEAPSSVGLTGSSSTSGGGGDIEWLVNMVVQILKSSPYQQQQQQEGEEEEEEGLVAILFRMLNPNAEERWRSFLMDMMDDDDHHQIEKSSPMEDNEKTATSASVALFEDDERGTPSQLLTTSSDCIIHVATHSDAPPPLSFATAAATAYRYWKAVTERHSMLQNGSLNALSVKHSALFSGWLELLWELVTLRVADLSTSTSSSPHAAAATTAAGAHQAASKGEVTNQTASMSPSATAGGLSLTDFKNAIEFAVLGARDGEDGTTTTASAVIAAAESLHILDTAEEFLHAVLHSHQLPCLMEALLPPGRLGINNNKTNTTTLRMPVSIFEWLWRSDARVTAKSAQLNAGITSTSMFQGCAVGPGMYSPLPGGSLLDAITGGHYRRNHSGPGGGGGSGTGGRRRHVHPVGAHLLKHHRNAGEIADDPVDRTTRSLIALSCPLNNESFEDHVRAVLISIEEALTTPSSLRRVQQRRRYLLKLIRGGHRKTSQQPQPLPCSMSSTLRGLVWRSLIAYWDVQAEQSGTVVSAMTTSVPTRYKVSPMSSSSPRGIDGQNVTHPKINYTTTNILENNNNNNNNNSVNSSIAQGAATPTSKGDAQFLAACRGSLRDIHEAYALAQTNVPNCNDRQIAVDIPRCHQYDPYLCSTLGHVTMLRVLKSWLVKHPSMIYWQGIDSVCAVVLSVTHGDEALSLAMLSLLMRRWVPHFFVSSPQQGTMDQRLLQLSLLLRFYDPELALHLEGVEQCKPELYAISWFLTLFAHVLPLRKVILVWDFLLASGKPDSVLCVACSLLMAQRQELLGVNDFSMAISILTHHVNQVDIVLVIEEAAALLRATPPSILSPNFASSLGTSLRTSCCCLVEVSDLLALYRRQQRYVNSSGSSDGDDAEEEDEEEYDSDTSSYTWGLDGGVFLIDIRTRRELEPPRSSSSGSHHDNGGVTTVEEDDFNDRLSQPPPPPPPTDEELDHWMVSRVLGALRFPFDSVHGWHQGTDVVLKALCSRRLMWCPPQGQASSSSSLRRSCARPVEEETMTSHGQRPSFLSATREASLSPLIILLYDKQPEDGQTAAESLCTLAGMGRVCVVLGGLSAMRREAPELFLC